MQADSFDFLLRFFKKINQELNENKHRIKNWKDFDSLFEIKIQTEYFCECFQKKNLDLKDREEKTCFINVGLEIVKNKADLKKSLDTYFNNTLTNKFCSQCKSIIKGRSKLEEIPQYFIVKIEVENGSFFDQIKNIDQIDLTPYCRDNMRKNRTIGFLIY
jgi:uncharacterized UBP type Zn finger protein